MPNLLKVQLMGHLGKDPEQRETASGRVVSFSMGVTPEKGGPTFWARVSVWGKQGDAVLRYLKKGSAAYVDGRLKVTEKDGKTFYDVSANDVQFLDSKPRSSSAAVEAVKDHLGGDELPF